MRIWKASDNRELLSFYHEGKKLATYVLSIDRANGMKLSLRDANVFFGKRLVRNGRSAFVLDRLGAARAWSGSNGTAGSAKFLPFGEPVRSVPGGSTAFDGYEPDKASRLLYAQQRYYSPTIGRFLTPDPYDGSAHPSNPDSWNRYAFVTNDPLNKTDPTGLDPGSMNACVGSSFPTANSAAEVGAMNIVQTTNENNQEYGEFVIFNLATGESAFTTPFTSDNDLSITMPAYSPPAGWTTVGTIHTHTDTGGDDFSVADMTFTVNSGLPSYLGTSDGTFKELTVDQAQAALDANQGSAPGTTIAPAGAVNGGPPSTCD
jgi:RHS repeat-associated protein